MFNKVILGALLTFFAGFALASTAKMYFMKSVLECDSTENIIKMVTEEYGERPYFSGIGYINAENAGLVKGLLIIATNIETGTFTVALTLDDGTSCIIAAGDEFGPFETEVDPQI